MSLADDAWSALSIALTSTDPACLNDGRFILDDQPAATLRYVCDACPIYELCRGYARCAKPTGGVWAGKRWGSRKGTNDEEP